MSTEKGGALARLLCHAPTFQLMTAFKKRNVWTTVDIKRMLIEEVTVLRGKIGEPVEKRVVRQYFDKGQFCDDIWYARNRGVGQERPILRLGPLCGDVDVAAVISALAGIQQKLISIRKEVCQVEDLQRRQKLRRQRFDARMKKYGFPSANSPRITVLTDAPSYVRAKKRRQDVRWFHISGGVWRFMCAIGPIAYLRCVYCPVIEVQMGAGAQLELKSVGSSFRRNEGGILEVDTPQGIIDFLKSNLRIGRVFETNQINEILDDDRFVLGRRAYLLERLSRIRSRLQAPVSLDDDQRLRLRQDIVSLTHARSMLLRAVSSESAKVGELIDGLIEEEKSSSLLESD